jgi:cyclophilin family peptidyl-prolyl cis-trans isomerase
MKALLLRRLLVGVLGFGLLTPPVFAAGVGVLMQTSLGDIRLDLYPDKAPKTVANFLHYVDQGFYDGTVFHRVIEGFMIQGGGFDTSYERKPTDKPIPSEADNGLKNERGTIAMARTTDPNSATSQFFINEVDNPALDFTGKSLRGWGYAVFGRVTDGMDVVEHIASQPTEIHSAGLRDVPREMVVIRHVTRIPTETKAQ